MPNAFLKHPRTLQKNIPSQMVMLRVNQDAEKKVLA
jgi:hypothetical protein